MSERPPQAPGRVPLLGHTPSLLRAPLASLERWGDTDAPVTEVGVAGRRMVLVSDPALVREVLATDADAYRKAELVRERLGTLQGGSLVLLEGEQWRERRERLQPAFAPERVAGVDALTARWAGEMVADWPDDGVVRADEHARDIVLALLGRALFGLDLRGEDTPIHDAADDVLARMDLRSVSTYLPEWVPTPTNLRFRRAVATLHDRLDDTVERRRRGDEDGEDLLSTMVASGMPADVVRDELVALLFAGFDSTATALSCTLGLLGAHPDLQAEVREELDAVLGDRAPDYDDLPDLPLVDAVVRESLRLYPPQYLLFREPVEAVSLGGYRVPAGTTVVLPPWVCHRDGQFWQQPDAFRPRRWLDGTGGDGSDGEAGDGDRPTYAYFPYGGGPRHCLGARLADQTLRTVVATVCRRRRLGLVGELSVTAGPTLALDGGVELRVRTR
jgi:cytochrome P450